MPDVTKIAGPKRTEPHGQSRRGFLTSAAVGVATAMTTPAIAASPKDTPPPVSNAKPLPPPGATAIAAETTPPAAESLFVGRTGSDYMIDSFKSLSIPYATIMPGQTVRGIHESLINYGGNRHPELLTCLHEEIAVAMAHGYAKVISRPLLAMMSGAVGLQHAAMSFYNAWCDRIPLIAICGNHRDANERGPIESLHSAQDLAIIVRDYVKWDDQPASLVHFSESLTRAYELAVTPPAGPVLLIVDGALQETETSLDAKRLPQLRPPNPPVGDPGAVEEAAAMLVAAQNPVIVVDRSARTPAGVTGLVQLAEALQAPVVDRGGRMNMPSRHYLNQTKRAGGIVRQADVVLGIEVNDFWGTVNTLADVTHREERRVSKEGAKLITLTSEPLGIRSNFQDFQRRQDVALGIIGDGEATLPYLVEAVRRKLGSSGAREDRAKKLKDTFAQLLRQDSQEAAIAWEATPISIARLCAEVGKALEGHDWSLASHDIALSSWPHRLWNFKEHHQYLGHMGGIGIGYTVPGAIGSALSLKDRGTLTAIIVGDGDFLCTPQALWTAAHHKIPLLVVVHNNRAYNQEVMHVQRMACRHSRGVDRAHIGTAIGDPNIDFSLLARGQGVWGAGPISDPKDLGPALKRAIEVVRRGEPALIDVLSQPR